MERGRVVWGERYGFPSSLRARRQALQEAGREKALACFVLFLFCFSVVDTITLHSIFFFFSKKEGGGLSRVSLSLSPLLRSLALSVQETLRQSQREEKTVSYILPQRLPTKRDCAN